MPPSQHLLIYAELLSNIRQVSVGCTLPTPVSISTRATVAADGLVLTVAHDGLSQSIQLPEVVASSSQLPVQSSAGTRLSWRLPLAAQTTSRVLPASEESVPWSAKDLGPGSPVACRTCMSTIVEAGTLQVWKDLPSENWAEMMEFWHCHKPHEHKHGNDDDDLTNRGYGASSRIAAQSSVGFVDLTSFLLAESDVLKSSISFTTGINTIGDKSNGNRPVMPYIVRCSSCRTQLGVRNDETSSISIFKWQVLVKESTRNAPDPSPTLAQCVSAMLLATMARSGCSKSILLPMKVQSGIPKSRDICQFQDLLNIWVFNANITFSSTEAPTSPVNAVKVFYRMINQEEANRILESLTSDVQDISLPSEAITTIVELLNTSNSFVPESDRRFKEWTVGLLGKWNGQGG